MAYSHKLSVPIHHWANREAIHLENLETFGKGHQNWKPPRLDSSFVTLPSLAKMDNRFLAKSATL